MVSVYTQSIINNCAEPDRLICDVIMRWCQCWMDSQESLSLRGSDGNDWAHTGIKSMTWFGTMKKISMKCEISDIGILGFSVQFEGYRLPCSASDHDDHASNDALMNFYQWIRIGQTATQSGQSIRSGWVKQPDIMWTCRSWAYLLTDYSSQVKVFLSVTSCLAQPHQSARGMMHEAEL